MGFCKSRARLRTISSGTHPSFSSGLTFSIGHQFLTSFLYLYSAVVPGRQLVNTQPSQSPVRCRQAAGHPTISELSQKKSMM